MMRVFILCMLLCLSLSAQAHRDIACEPARDKHGRIARSAAAVAQFKRANPCPAGGKIARRCPGYVVDHIIPLCACGADTPANMQWQDAMAGRQKDVLERLMCDGSGD